MLQPAAAQPPNDPPGLSECEEHTPNCGPKNRIGTTTVASGETETYSNDTYTVTGTVTIESGGTVIVDNATLRFKDGSDGFVVLAGGELRISDSALEPADNQTELNYAIDAQANSTLVMHDSSLLMGRGLKVATEDASLTRNVLEAMALAMHLNGVSIRLEDNEFVDNDVALNATGGAPTIHGNVFVNGTYGIRDWRTNPTITNNSFRGPHYGIWHEQSESTLSGNDLEDNGVPPGAGIAVVDTESPVIEDNVIRNYHTGVLIINARAFIRNNTIETSVTDGIRVETNTLTMDIQGNVIRDNGRDGIRLMDATDVPVFENDVHSNGGTGILVLDSTGISIERNLVHDNGGDGIRVKSTPSVVVSSNEVESNDGSGILVDALSFSATIDNNEVHESGAHGIETQSNGTVLSGNLVTESLGGDGVRVVGAAGVSIDETESRGNADAGFRFVNASSLAVADVLASANVDGVVVVGAASGNLTRANASANTRDGFAFDSEGQQAMTELHLARAIGNGRDGVRNADGNATRSVDGWFEDNGAFGANNLDANVSIDLRYSYWGSGSGPTHASNPNGAGDAVSDGVLFDPWLTVPPGSAPPPAMIA